MISRVSLSQQTTKKGKSVFTLIDPNVTSHYDRVLDLRVEYKNGGVYLNNAPMLPSQIKQALRDSKLCRCGDCVCCGISKLVTLWNGIER